jgi:hypothetical protein
VLFASGGQGPLPLHLENCRGELNLAAQCNVEPPEALKPLRGNRSLADGAPS